MPIPHDEIERLIGEVGKKLTGSTATEAEFFKEAGEFSETLRDDLNDLLPLSLLDPNMERTHDGFLLSHVIIEGLLKHVVNQNMVIDSAA